MFLEMEEHGQKDKDAAMVRFRLLMDDGRVKWVSLIFRTETDRWKASPEQGYDPGYHQDQNGRGQA